MKDINQIVVHWPQYVQALVEKSQALLVQGNWDETMVTAQRVLAKEKFNIDALLVCVVYLLAKDSKSDRLLPTLQSLADAIARNEPKNDKLYFRAAQLCARMSMRNPDVLNIALRLVKTAMQLAPTNADYITEQAYELMLLGTYDQASSIYMEATKIDDTNVTAAHGRIYCLIEQNRLGEAQQELEVVNQVQSALGESAYVLFLNGLMAWRKDKNQSASIDFLTRGVEQQVSEAEKIPRGFDYLIAYNPDHAIDVGIVRRDH